MMPMPTTTSPTTPTISPPMNAPCGLPTPPRIAAAKIGRSKTKPNSGDNCDSSDRSQRSSCDPGPATSGRDVDPAGARQGRVIGHRSHGGAEPGVIELQIGENRQHEGGTHDEKLIGND